MVSFKTDDVIGVYRVIRPPGKGGMGAVYEVVHAKKSKDIFQAYVIEDCPIYEVAARFGIPNNSVSRIKTRVERMIADYESMLD